MKFKCADETNYTSNDLCFCSFNSQNYGRNGMMREKVIDQLIQVYKFQMERALLL